MATTYEIKPGDTLGAIAKANQTTVANLQSLNPQITDPNKIYAGQNLTLSAQNPINPVTPTTKVGTGVMTADTLSDAQNAANLPTPPVDTTNYNGIVASGAALTTPDTTDPNKPPAWLQGYLDNAPKPTNLMETYNTITSQEGLDDKRKLVNDLTAQLNSITAETQVGALKLKEEGLNAAGANARNITNERNAAIRSLPIQAQLSAAQGNLQLAQDKVNTLFTIQSKYETDMFNYKQNLIDKVFDYATDAEKEKLADKRTQQAQAFQMMTNSLNQAQTLANEAIKNGQGDVATKIMKLNPKSPTYTQDLAGFAGEITARPEKPTIFGTDEGGYYQQAYDPATNSYKISPVTRGTGSGGGSIPSTVNPELTAVLNTILGSGKFTAQQTKAITTAIASGEDPFTVVKNQAKALMGSSVASDVTKYETARNTMTDLQSNLSAFYAAGGKTNIFDGNYEKAINKLGEISNPDLVDLAVQIQAQLQVYRNAVSGTAYSVQEGKDIASIFPGINKTQGLNDAIVKGRLKAFDSTIDGTYRAVLGSGYDNLLNSQGSTQNNQYTSTLDSLLGEQGGETQSTTPVAPSPETQPKGGLIQQLAPAVSNLWNWLTGK